jgi:hypothetical protein
VRPEQLLRRRVVVVSVHMMDIIMAPRVSRWDS